MTYALRNCIATVLLIGLATAPRQAATSEQSSPATRAAEQIVLSVDPARSTVHWSVESSLHTVHGTFHVKRGTVSVDPATGKASGEIVVDATSGESGNDGRDRRMHKEILESAQYSEVVFRPDHADGTIVAQGNSNLKLHGIFSLHGADHELSVPAQAMLKADEWSGTAAFEVPYIKWGLKNPSNFLLKVKPFVDVQLDLAGSVRQAR
ncbi:MAG TPA: YceI family protein [Candidatus Acidoferrum sp.]|jgi:polyisoprenoid-binding protein YceI|nr:YceI family protein [Candidatus Acidoferrum sp.]